MDTRQTNKIDETLLLGLTEKEVNKRIDNNLINIQPDNLTKSVKDIVKGNVITLFNILNLVLAVIIISMGELKNAIFIGVAISNTIIGIYQELKFKKTIDELTILAENKVSVIRDGNMKDISQEKLVLDDIFLIKEGGQIPTDGTIVKTDSVEVDESLLTGEPDNISKEKGDSVLSGSFIISGKAYIRVTSVGKDNYATRLSIEAKSEEDKKSKLMRSIDNIIRVLTIIIVPIGLLLFYSSYRQGDSFRISVLSASAAMLGMIPEGLILLTSVTFAVGAMNLAKHKTLVQTLPSIETLARADILCLDKTGTITDGNLTLEEIIPLYDFDKYNMKIILSEIMRALDDNNATAKAIKESVSGDLHYNTIARTPFSSSRKWSGATFEEKGSYLIGSPEFLFNKIDDNSNKLIDKYINRGLRVLALGYSKETINNNRIPNNLTLKGLLIFSDNLRSNSVETFEYFVNEGVQLKIISGDNAVTVSNIANQAKIPNSDKYIDMSKVSEYDNYKELANEYTVFGRVSPHQKRELIRGLKENEKTVCMTGDGVNDILALKEADCAVAMAGGSDAAKSVSDFVLMNKDFGSMVEVLKEGRRVINNIENVSSLYLIKTIYSTVLALLFIFLPFAYPFSPLQMSPINSLTVGIPSFILALEANYKKPDGKFLSNVLENSVPAAITVIFNIIIIQLAGLAFNLKFEETSTMSVLLTGVVGFIVLYKVSKPLDWKKNLMLITLFLLFISVFTYFREFFNFESLFTRNVFFYLPLIFFSRESFSYINSFVLFSKRKYYEFKGKRRK